MRTTPPPLDRWPIRLHTAVLAATVACGGVAAGCSRAHPTTAPAAGSATADSARAARDVVGPIELQIQNRGTSEVVVYVVRGSIRQRLATVSPVSQTVAVVPATFTDDRTGVMFYVRPIAGSTSFTSDRVIPRSGDRLVLTLQTRLSQSTLIVQ